MGTNFYIRRKPTLVERKHMAHLALEGLYKELKDYIDNKTIEYHIGKRSYGWQFLFASYSKISVQIDKGIDKAPWHDTLKSLKEFLEQPEYEIFDEYGRTYTPQQFWIDEVGESLYFKKGKYTNGAAEDQNAMKNGSLHMSSANFEYVTTDGLRFAYDPDFS